jgi:hypothetical protein
MSLYVRVHCGYWTHRKTLRLVALLGPEAVCIPIRLWCYAAQNQPDGDFSKYLAEELALLLGYQACAQALLEALHKAGFLEGMRVHGWDEHNAYHQTFSERARTAARARWDKKGKERKGKETSIASSMLQASDTKPRKNRMTMKELQDFCISLGLPASDGDALFNKWEGNGWKNGKEPIIDCKATIRNWKAQGYLPSQKNGTSKPHSLEVRL